MSAKNNLLRVKIISNNSSLFAVIKNYLFPITLWTRCSALYKMKGWWCRDKYQWQQTNTDGKAERQTEAHEFSDHLANIGQFSAAHIRTEEMHLWICVVRAKEQERNIAMHCMKVGSSIEFAGIACSTKVGEKSHMNMNNSAANVHCGGWASDFIEVVAAYRCSYVICVRFWFIGIRMQGIGEWDYLLDLWCHLARDPWSWSFRSMEEYGNRTTKDITIHKSRSDGGGLKDGDGYLDNFGFSERPR